LGGSGAISYQWKRGTASIGANSSTYTVQTADVGSTITVAVTRSGNSGSLTSAAVGPVTAEPATGITIDLADMDEWELTEQTAQAEPGVNKVFTVTGTYAAYQWYLDGVSVGTTSSYTFNMPPGVYQLAVVVRNSNGEKRSGRCRITVEGQFGQPLSANAWANDSISIYYPNSVNWYSFPVTKGVMYHIWWNDSKAGNGTRTGDVVVSAMYENEIRIFSSDSGWSSAQSFTANQTGTVYVSVRAYYYFSYDFGSYSIVYSTNTTRP
jgi:hypothetical protein